MSKERLEEFREFIDFMYESIDIEDHQRFVAISESMIKDGWFKWIYRYVKEQAERVQDLESESYNAHLERLLDRREQQNKRYHEALVFYADPSIYNCEAVIEQVNENEYEAKLLTTGDIFTDFGGKARKALEESE